MADCRPINGRYCIHGWHEGDDLSHDERKRLNDVKAAEWSAIAAWEASIPDG